MSSTSEHPSGSPLPELAWAITNGAVRLAAATASWLRLVAEFDERGGWHGVGFNSCAHWLSWQCGMSSVTAREHVRVARALSGLPRISAAFSAGRLSYAKVRALTRIAAPEFEPQLLGFAMSATAAQTEKFCRAWRRVEDHDGNGSALRPDLGPSFETWTDDEGYMVLKVRMPAESGAALMVAVDSLAERDARRERAQAKKAQAEHERLRTAGAQVDREVEERCLDDEAARRVRRRTAGRRVAALAALAEARATMDRRPGDPPRREVVVHVDADVLADDTAAGRAHFEGGPAITGAQARRMLCDASVVVMLEKGREPLALGRRKRRATKAQRLALLRRDGGCARPGCPETRIERLHAHHMRHWMYGGRTDLTNLVLLCDVDHGLVHDHDLVLSRRNGRLIVLTPDGHHIWGTADAAFVDGLHGIDAVPAEDWNSPFVGVHPFDTVVGRRPMDAPPPERDTRVTSAPGGSLRRRRPLPGRPRNRRPGRSTALRAKANTAPAREAARLSRVLFPEGEPSLADSLQEHYDRMDLRYAISVLMGNRDVVRRLAAESGVSMTG